MKAIGFSIIPVEFIGENNVIRQYITLQTPGSQPDVTNSKKKVPEKYKLSASIIASLKAKMFEIEQEITSMEGAPSVGAAVRQIRMHHSAAETRQGVETALTVVKNILTSPRDIKMYRVKKSNPLFFRTLGHMRDSDMLMRAINFISVGTNAGDLAGGAVYILKSMGGKDSFDAMQHVQDANITMAGMIYLYSTY
jgi:hypothetical protein